MEELVKIIIKGDALLENDIIDYTDAESIINSFRNAEYINEQISQDMLGNGINKEIPEIIINELYKRIKKMKGLNK